MTIDIRSTGFLRCPKDELPSIVKQGTIGVIGHGFVGKAVEAFFADTCRVLIYDRKGSPNTLQQVVDGAEVIFLCLPTPMREDGSCHTDIIDSVIGQVRETALASGRPLDSFVLVVKSTVNPGFTEEMQEKYLPLRIVFSPEFLTEKNAVEDFKNCNRIIVAGDQEDANVVLSYFCGVKHVYDRATGIPERRVVQKYEELFDGPSADSAVGRQVLLEEFYKERTVAAQKSVVLYHEEIPSVAEMAKLFTNGILTTKVMFCNEIYQICEKLGIEYDEVRVAALLDRRIGDSHTVVPGHDGQLGYGGHCFPKDINNLRAVCRELGIDEKIFTAVIDRNEQVREDKDWLRMEGRAVLKGTSGS
jgi:UDPglucose 6-dehydrogenase